MTKIPPYRRRTLRIWTHSQNPNELETCEPEAQSSSLIDLASNDYLGLSRHPNLIEAAQSVMHSQGVGAGGSRLVTGSRPIHKEMEEALANWLGRERVLLFPSGFQANIAAVLALANRSSPVFADRLIHHSLLLGVKACGARFQRYAHNDLKDLGRRLYISRQKFPKQQPLVITESLFSMEGTNPQLKGMAELCDKYEAKLLVDEAHALGVFGNQGRGLCYGLPAPVGIISGTFGKAFGSGGAFLASDAKTAEDLLQKSGAFRYTTALAPPLTAAALAALKLIEANPKWGLELLEKAQNWRSLLVKNGFHRPPGSGQIISIVFGSDELALRRQNQLEEKGILSIAIRPPTVPEGTSRLRLAIRKDLPNGVFKKLLAGLTEE